MDFPFTAKQTKLYADQLTSPTRTQYIIGLDLDIPASIDPDMMQAAIHLIVNSCDTLSITLVMTKQGECVQQCHPAKAYPASSAYFDFLDCHQQADPEATFAAHKQGFYDTPFDLFNGPLFTTKLYRLDQQRYRLLVKAHQLVADEYTLQWFSQRLDGAYQHVLGDRGADELADCFGFKDAIIREQAYLCSCQYQQDKAFWLAKTTPLPDLLFKPLEGQKTPKKMAFSQARLRLSDDLTIKLRALAEQANKGLEDIGLVALAVYFCRVYEREKMLIGTNCLSPSDEKQQMGLASFRSPVACLLRPSESESLSSLLANIGQERQENAHHDAFSACHLAAEVAADNTERIFDLLFSYQRADTALTFVQQPVVVRPIYTVDAFIPLHCRLLDLEGGQALCVQVSVQEGLMDERQAQLFVERIGYILQQFTEQPLDEIQVASIDCLPPKEKRLLQSFSGPQVLYQQDQVLNLVMEQRAAQRPNAVAACHRDEQWQYAKLNKQANKIAHALLSRGVEKGQVVAVYAHRNILYLAAMLGIWKAGAVYMPLDPKNPKDRIGFFLEDAKPEMILLDGDLRANLPPLYRHRSITLTDKNNFVFQSDSNPANSNSSVDPAYIIYTSGSTGKPKGAMVHHGGAMHHINIMLDALGLVQQGQLQPLVMLQSASASSDISLWQFAAPVVSGGTSVILDDMVDMQALCQVIRQHQVQLVECVPVVLRLLIDYLSAESKSLAQGISIESGHQDKALQASGLPSLRWMMTTGDTIAAPLVNDWFALGFEVPIVNAYGPTETSDDVALHVIDKPFADGVISVPIGKPLANTSIHIVNSRQDLLPIGVVGELCISGPCVGLGYLNDPVKTAQKFVANPFAGAPDVFGEQMYCSGDLASWGSDGLLRFVGRMDNQVKIRGHRIELGDVESVLAKHPYIGDLAVILVAQADGEKQLYAFLTLKENRRAGPEKALIDHIKQYALSQLPDYMVPSQFRVLAQMPRNMADKIDRKALAQMSAEGRANPKVSEILAAARQSLSLQLKQAAMKDAAQAQYLVNELNQTQYLCPRGVLIHEVFEVKAAINANKTALVFEDQSLSYRELNAAANRLAHYLREQGVVAQTLVGLCVERSLDMMIGILAILKAGGAYVPLDPSYPVGRLHYMLQDSQLKYLLTQKGLTQALDLASGSGASMTQAMTIIELDEAPDSASFLQNYSSDDLPRGAGQNTSNLAYVIYTSGSTGHPKGVMIEHTGVVNLALAQQALFNLNECSRVLHFASLSFDAGVSEWVMALLKGATLCICTQAERQSPLLLSQFLLAKGITHATIPPSLLAELPMRNDYSLQALVVAGESCNRVLANKWLAHYPLINAYGPSEMTVCATGGYLTQDQPIHIGKPIANTEVLVLSDNKTLLPKGEIGELYIAGAGLARGYLNKPELTAQRFIDLASEADLATAVSERRWYKSGDLVRYLPNGNLEFIDRVDDQVKIRGFRIELGEIEQCLHYCSAVHSCQVLAREDEPGEKRLVAYVVVDSNPLGAVGSGDLLAQFRSHLSHRLPAYMLPSAFVLLEKFPLTQNGKIDKKALPAPDRSLFQGVYVAPITATEQALTRIWARLLKLDPETLSVTANFFELGGHSLLAIRLIADIRVSLAQEISVQTLFDKPQLMALAADIEAGSNLMLRPTVEAIDRQDCRLSLSFAQQRLWFIDQLEQGSAHYNIPMAMLVEGVSQQDSFDVPIAEQAFQRLIDRHEPLRTVFTQDAQGPVQVIRTSTNFHMTVHDLSSLSALSQQYQLNRLIEQDATTAFDLAADLMIRASYVHLAKASSVTEESLGKRPLGVLLLNTHHIAADGWSMGILLNEFAALYEALKQGQEASLEPLAIQYLDYALWQRQWLTGEVLQAQLDYWQTQLKALPRVHGLALDFPRPDSPAYQGGVVMGQIPFDSAQALQSIAQREAVTLFMLLHGALALVLSRHSDTNDIVIGTPTANRLQRELEPLIGFFVNTLVLRTRHDFETLSDYLAHVKQVNLAAQANQDVPFDKLVEVCQVARSRHYTPLFQIVFAMNNNDAAKLQLPGLMVSPLEEQSERAVFDIEVTAQFTPQKGLQWQWLYDTALFSAAHIEQLNRHLQQLLINIARAPQAKLSDLSMLSAAETHELVNGQPDISTDYPPDTRMYQWLLEPLLDPAKDLAIKNLDPQLLVLGRNKTLLPKGVIGELYIGGNDVIESFLHEQAVNGPVIDGAMVAGQATEQIDRALTGNPFSDDPKACLYATGERVRYRADGCLEFVGWVEDQVTIGGQRIDLGEIEQALNNFELVRLSKLLVGDDEQGQEQLVAYVVLTSKGRKSPAVDDELRRYLASRLEDHLQPAAFVIVKKFPLLANGQIDKQALSLVAEVVVQEVYMAPRSELEKALVEIWADLLKLDPMSLSVNGNFFALGGHSLLVARLIGEIRTKLAKEVAIKTLYDAPSIAQLAAQIDDTSHLALRSRVSVVDRQKQRLCLSFAQQRLWIIDRLEQGSAHYNIPLAMGVDGEANDALLADAVSQGHVGEMGEFDVAVAEQAIGRLIERHEPLRTVFKEDQQGPIQVIQEHFDFRFTVHDLSHLSTQQQDHQINLLMTQDLNRPFDLSSDLMIRASYVYLSSTTKAASRLAETGAQGAFPDQSNRRGVLLFNMHHIASDGWSKAIFIKEFIEQYQAIIQGQSKPFTPLPVQYLDYALWQRDWLQGDVLATQLAYWQTQLAKVPAVHSLALDFSRPDVKQHKGRVVTGHMAADMAQQLQAIAQGQSSTLFMVLHGALSLVLSRHSNTNDVVIGTPVANRLQTELEPLIGFFVNTLVLRTRHDFVTFSDYLAHVKQVNLDAQANQDVPFDHLVELCQVVRSTAHTPLFQILFSMDSNEEETLALPGLRFSPLECEEAIAKFDLDISVTLSAQGIEWRWIYDEALFTQAHIEQLNSHVQQVLHNIARAPQSKLSELSMLSPAEQYHLLHENNQTQTDYPTEQCIHEVFEEQALCHPHNLALVFEDQSLSYQALNAAANRLAHYLRAQGVVTQTLVGLCIERSLDMMIGILAILKAGGAYVPLDPNYPSARLQYMLDDSQLSYLLMSSRQALPDTLQLAEKVKIIALDEVNGQQQFASYSSQNRRRDERQTSHDLAYVIYTSGSTGNPKGVMIEHTSAVNLAFAQQAFFELSEQSKVLHFASLSFDASVFEWLMALLKGATLCICSESQRQSPAQLSQLLLDQAITHATIPPSLLAQLPIKEDYSLQALVVAGEACNQALAELWLAHYPLVNAYGPSETTVCATAGYVSTEQGIHIGKPIANTQLLVLSENKELLPKGAIGELYVAGTGLARGYLNQPKLTAERFVALTFAEQAAVAERWYKTGDLVRYLADGNVEFIGRVDDQVKIRGFRIELGEIEQCLHHCSAVQSCVVLAREDQPGEKHLVAYVVTKQVECSEPLSERDLLASLRTHLLERLPVYMLPSAFVVLPQLPLTANGKIDKSALPLPDGLALEGEYVAPSTATEQALVAIWARLLKREADGLSVTANFFEIGGHSLLAVRMMSDIRATFDHEMSIKTLFEYSTIRAIAQIIDVQHSVIALDGSVSDMDEDDIEEMTL